MCLFLDHGAGWIKTKTHETSTSEPMINGVCPFLTLCAVETTQCCDARLPQRSAMAAHEARKVPKQITRSLAILTRTMREEHSNVEEVGRLKVAQCSLLLFSSTLCFTASRRVHNWNRFFLLFP